MRKYVVPIGARYGSILIQFVVLAVITRSLSQADAGRYFVIMGIIQATMCVAGIGLPDGVVRFVPVLHATGEPRQAASLLHRGLMFSLATIPVGAVLCGGAAAIYLGSWIPATIAGLWWASYGLIFVSAQIVVASGRGSLGTAIFYSAANVGQLLVTIQMILLASLNRLDTVLFAVTAGTSISAAVSTIVAWRLSRRGTDGKRCSLRSLRNAWQQGGTIATNRVVMGFLNWAPVWIASFALGASDAAVVGLASRLAAVVGALSAAMRFSMRPVLARDAALGNWQAIETRASKVGAFATVFATGGLVAMLVVGPAAIPWVYGSDYHTAAIITALMLIGTVGASVPVDEVLKMSGHAHVVLTAQVVTLVVGFGAQFLAGELGGITALAVAYSAGTVLMYLALVVYLWRRHGVLILPGLARRRD